MRLANKTAIITGGGSGIGFACAKLFVREGAKVVLSGRREKNLGQALDELGEDARAVVGDIKSAEVQDQIIEDTLTWTSKIDILVNNAGLFQIGALHESTSDDWDNSFDINLKSIFSLIQKTLPVMLKQKSGNFIHISSVLGLRAAEQTAIYSATKAALIQLGKSIAVEYGQEGIRSNSICPGFIETEMTNSLLEDKGFMEELLKRYPLGRYGQVEEVANACLFLASEESSFITGTTLPVDGGYTA